MTDDVKARAAKVKVLLMDVDGVLTNGKLYFIPDGAGGMVEFKGFDSQDGIGLQWCFKQGIRTGVISGRNSPATVERAKQAKMTWVFQGHTEKIPIIEGILWVTEHVGGDGAVRDAVELILEAQGLWDAILKHYEARKPE
jgi:3-deoxy-D-manno-octulosonate 8-phosphate phosphatase (KDO 8-P phosphatase)